MNMDADEIADFVYDLYFSHRPARSWREHNQITNRNTELARKFKQQQPTSAYERKIHALVVERLQKDGY